MPLLSQLCFTTVTFTTIMSCGTILAYNKERREMAYFTSNKLRIFLLLLLIFMAILIAGFIFKYFANLPDSISVNITEDGVDVGIKNFNLVEEKNGKQEWVLKAAEAEMLYSQGITKLTKMDLTISRPKKESVKLTSDRGVVENKTKDMEALGNVVVFDGKFTLKSERLKWKAATKNISSEEFITITGGNFKVTGTGLLSNVEEEKIELLNNVVMFIDPEKDE